MCFGKKNRSPKNRDKYESKRTESIRSSVKHIKVRAVHNYCAENDGDLDFRKGDILIVTNKSKDRWWEARHTVSGEVGLIPSNYVVIDDGSPTSVDGWFDISRAEADKNLLRPGYPEGTYIIRPSTESKQCALSIRYFDKMQGYHVVKHYKICTTNDGCYYINPENKFPIMQQLIDHYTKNKNTLCCFLVSPFPRTHVPPVQFREIEVNRNCLTMERKLGSGSFGDVWYAKWNKTVGVAVKMLKDNGLDDTLKESFLTEAKLMHQLNHPRIVEILGVCSEPLGSPVLIITELLTKGSLLSYIRSNEGQKLIVKDMLLMMHQIADGMSYLESKNFIHRDLRAANILVAEDVSVKVADFGLARVTETVYECAKGSKFPIKWTAPEAGLRRTFSTKSDVWSFGVLMFEILTYGMTPYSTLDQKKVLEEVDNGYRMPNPSGGKVLCPNEVYAIMLSCWDANPATRPTFSHLKNVFGDFAVATENNYD